ncbi:unnamed protein product [Strongylus vulgaris]|uniref:Uncharacterized protein n=1 Tax=Strongylus vulgaris TaxID=40348 RepID=A0A3P7KEI8_STRVU|nr:unnamed protein product [Strongylus vulgaris]
MEDQDKMESLETWDHQDSRSIDGQCRQPGNSGTPGTDAAYSPCPLRSAAMVNRKKLIKH